MTVVDASVVTAFYAPSDASHARAQQWYDNHGAAALAIPSIALSELAAGLRQQGTSEHLIGDALTTAAGVLTVYAVDEGLALRAAEIAAVRTIRGCDAIYVALAEALDDELVTFDRQQASAAEGLVGVRQL